MIKGSNTVEELSMLRWAQLYHKISIYFNDFGRTLEGVDFNEKENAAEVFILTCLKLSMKNADAIALLLKKDLFCQAMMIMRSTLEALFKINWVLSGKDEKQRNENAFQLEGKPFSDFEAEISDQEDYQNNDKHFFPNYIIEKWRYELNNIKQKNPFLLTANGEFKTPKESMKKWDKEFSEANYHFFRTLCFFCHPNPRVRDFLLSCNGEYRDIDQSIKDGLLWGTIIYREMLRYSILFFEKNSMDAHQERIVIFNRIDHYIEDYIARHKL